jgi:hypothetical protein
MGDFCYKSNSNMRRFHLRHGLIEVQIKSTGVAGAFVRLHRYVQDYWMCS